MPLHPFFRAYGFSFGLLLSVIGGSLLGLLLGESATLLKPFGDVFLNLLFTVVVPLVFFSISAAVCGMTNGRRLGRILGFMMVVFVVTGIIASVVMIVGVLIYPPAQGVQVALIAVESAPELTLGDQIVRAFTVPDFFDLLSRRNMLALIVFAFLTGIAAGRSGEEGKAFRELLRSGNAVMSRVIGYIMYYAPIGLGGYFAYLVGVFGPDLLGTYARAMVLYYPVAIGYFFIAFTLYALVGGSWSGVKQFWSNIMPVALTALATGSSVAAIPVNLEAAKRNGTPEDVREVVIPIGATIHMDGSCLSAILKIAILFGLFGREFVGLDVLLTAVGVALLSGTVMSGIPGGGFLGEMMIITLYGFPLEALPVISMIGALVDPPATMVNASGDNVSAMIVGRFTS